MLESVSSRTSSAVAVALTTTLLLAGCVTRSAYDGVVAERDHISEQNRNLRLKTAAVVDVALGLSAELSLREHELAALQREQEELADEIAAWAVLGEIKMQLLADGLHITLPHDVLFTTGAAELKPEGRKLLGELVAEIKQQQEIRQGDPARARLPFLN